MNTLEHEFPMGIGMRRVGFVQQRSPRTTRDAGALPYLLVALAIAAAAWGWTLMHGGLPPALLG
ncbi:MAG: hypothetical protein JSR18_10600 [Proteobacteria bacterium]|nr:hypothetical protein [Pseudomonadota bacterium]